MEASRLERMYWPEVEAEIRAGTPIVLPVGSIEQHGPHLPLGTDGFIPRELALRAGRARRLIVSPPLLYAAYSRPRTGGGRTFPGSTGIPGSALEEVVRSVVSDWFRQGFRNVLLLNGHFENAWNLLEALERAVEPYAEEGRKAVLVSWWDQVGDEDVRRIFGDAFPGWATEHASITETSLMEELLPELVKTELKAEGGAPRSITYDVLPTPPDIVWPTGVGFSAVPATRELGEQLAELLVGKLVAIIDAEFEKPVG